MIGGMMGVSVSETSARARFSRGEVIRIGMDFLGEDSVEGAYALFVNVDDHKHTIALSGNRGEDAGVSISMEGEAIENAAPGEYRCRYVQIHDVHDNYAVLYPEPQINFWVGHPLAPVGP